MLLKIGLRAHPNKTTIGADVVEFLGHLVCGAGIAPAEAHVAAVRALKAPTTLAQCRSLYGKLSYWRDHVENFAAVTSCISDLMKKDVVWDKHTWQPHHEAALQHVKDYLCTPGRGLFRVQSDLPTVVYVDWSVAGIGAVLAQVGPDGKERMCACVSRSLNVHERNYTSYKGEMLAAVWAVKTLRYYLHGRPFKLVTDHEPLRWLMTSRSLTGQYARWAMALQEYDFVVEHRAGKLNVAADCLSRAPLETTTDCTGARMDRDDDPVPPPPEFLGVHINGESMGISPAKLAAIQAMPEPENVPALRQ
jgi:hypothetical protein